MSDATPEISYSLNISNSLSITINEANIINLTRHAIDQGTVETINLTVHQVSLLTRILLEICCANFGWVGEPEPDTLAKIGSLFDEIREYNLLHCDECD